MPRAPIIGTRAAARLLDVDRVTLVRWVKSGRITPIGRISETPTGAFLFKREDVDQLVQDRARHQDKDGQPTLDLETA